jgi:hypothetical protein
MMRIVTATGNVKEVREIYTFAEGTLRINGKNRNIFEAAKNIKYATGLVFTLNANDCFNTQYDIIVGNLPNETVQEIIKSMSEQGYYDFSGFQWQKADSTDKVVIDGGKSLPYCSEFTMFDFGSLNSIKGNSPFNSLCTCPSRFDDSEAADDSELIDDSESGEGEND